MCSRSHLLCIGPANPLIAGDLRGPVTGAAGTRYFEPDGVAFLTIGLPPEPPCVAGGPLPVALPMRPAAALHPPSPSRLLESDSNTDRREIASGYRGDCAFTAV